MGATFQVELKPCSQSLQKFYRLSVALPQKSESLLDRVSIGSGSDLVQPSESKILREYCMPITDQVATAPCTARSKARLVLLRQAAFCCDQSSGPYGNIKNQQTEWLGALLRPSSSNSNAATLERMWVKSFKMSLHHTEGLSKPLPYKI